MVVQSDYNPLEVRAAYSVLLELTHVLGAYRASIVLVGGWVPVFLCPGAQQKHIGSMDVDLALDHRLLTDTGYTSIQQLLRDQGYRRQEDEQPYIFHRTVAVSGQQVKVGVDLLSGQYGGTGKGHRHQRVRELRLRKTRGADLAFETPVEVTVEGRLPNGVQDMVCIRVASIVPFLVMKGMALADRLKPKDPWDIYYCVRNYPGGLDRMVAEFQPQLKHSLVREGLEKIARNFASLGHVGPKSVAAFEEVTDVEEQERLERDAYERVTHLLRRLGAL